jgi:hypothetical protein
LNEENGATVVIVAISLVVLFGMGALVLDVGNLFWERRQLQNGADAGALAAAQDLASGETAATARASAVTYTSENNTRDAYMENMTQPTSNSVRVETITGNAGGDGVLQALLAGAIGTDDYFATADATATWSGIGGAASLPLTFSECEWDILTGGDLANLPTSERIVYFHDSQAAEAQNSCGGPANQDHPGGFGWLNPEDGECEAYIEDGQVSTDTGNNVPNECSSQFFADLIGTTVIMPIFSSITSPQGNNAVYQISGFAAVEITGYRLSGNPAYNYPSGSPPCSGQARCIRARFVQYYDLGAEPSDTTPDYGAYSIGLTG